MEEVPLDRPSKRRFSMHVDAHDDEIWAVLEGEITFFVGEQQYDLGPGDVAFGARGVPRRHVVRSRESRLLVTSVPTGIAEWFTRNGTPVAFAGELPPSLGLDAAVGLVGAYDLHVVGPPGNGE
ncbi:cupin domain-containing protein [Streptomyces sp. NPDC007095]|uniref:cupin domain-containing protein n=1 Tax=Streptomyces sp. NPDC007095 TaxID=3154482 RepID=UPI000C70BDC9